MLKSVLWAFGAALFMVFGSACSSDRVTDGSAVAPEPTLAPVHCDLIFPGPSAG